jgi:hypothetical protein
VQLLLHDEHSLPSAMPSSSDADALLLQHAGQNVPAAPESLTHGGVHDLSSTLSAFRSPWHTPWLCM